jgi:hypothetical protein
VSVNKRGGDMSLKKVVNTLKIAAVATLLGAASVEAYVMMLDFG